MNKEKFIKSFYLFGPSEIDRKKIKTIAKYKTINKITTNYDDDNAVALLCLPNGIKQEESDKNLNQLFHSFLITKENGLRIYGSCLIVWDKIYDEQTKQSFYFSKALCLITELPFIYCTERILQYIWSNKSSIEIIKLICNLNLPTMGRSICLKLPTDEQSTNLINNNNDNLDHQPFKRKSFNDNRLIDNKLNKISSQQEPIYIYAGTKNLPLFDYSLRYLFTEVLSIENFLIAFAACLLEYQILITSNSLYKLMLVSESLTNLLLPFQWTHVYVPILPDKLGLDGLHYLDAPTPYIMGVLNYDETSQNLNSSSGSFSISNNSIRCKIDCDLNYVEVYAEEGSIDIVGSNDDLSDESDDEDNRIDEKNKYTFIVPKFLSELQYDIENFINSDLRLKEHINKNQAITRISKIALKHNVISKFSYLDEIKFNQSIRQMFLNKLNSNLLSNYERYIVISKKDAVKFDSISFLSEQPVIIRTFLSKFLKTQLFANYIDESARKIAKNLSISSNDELCIIDTDNLVDEIDEQFDLDLNYDLDEIFNNSQLIDLNNLIKKNQQFNSSNNNNYDLNSNDEFNKYSNLHHNNLKQLNSPFKIYSPVHSRSSSARKNSLTQNSFSNNLTPFKNDKDLNNYLEQNDQIELMPNSPMRIQTERFASQTNYHVVENLLKEVKNKTKKILLEKMADEDSGDLNNSNDEESTLIASLCDLIERIWTHAKCSETINSRCRDAFWIHLSAYCKISNSEAEIAQIKRQQQQQDDNMSPVLAWVKKKIDYIGQNEYSSKTNKPSFFTSNHSPNQNQLTKKKLINPTLNSVRNTPNTIFYDYNTINNMTDIKTEIGKSRAFIRLALERKLLSKHLRTLLSNQQLTCAFYKRYSFLRCEDEKEQFLTHLLTLNAINLNCFTNTFTTSTFKYKLILYGSSTFTGFFSLSGSIFELNDQYISNSTSVFNFECRNLGLINNLTLRVSGNNKIYLEYCYLINEFTSQTYRFQCNRWLGKNIDDGACEFIVNGEQITNEKAIDLLRKSLLSKGSSIGRQLTKAFSEHSDRTIEIVEADELKDLLGKSINLIIRLYGHSPLPKNLIKNDLPLDSSIDKKYSNNQMIKKLNNKFLDFNGQFERSQVNKSTINNQLQSPMKTLKVKHQQELNKLNRTNRLQQNLIKLLFGDKQLLWILNEIFYYDFKNKRKSSFKKQQFVWDFILCIQLELKLILKENNLRQFTNQYEPSRLLIKQDEDNLKNQFIELIDRISSKAPLIGKDGKFQLFLLISLRENLLSKFIEFMDNQSILSIYYGTNGFLVDQNKSNFLKQILNSLNEINFILDQSFTKGL